MSAPVSSDNPTNERPRSEVPRPGRLFGIKHISYGFSVPEAKKAAHYDSRPARSAPTSIRGHQLKGMGISAKDCLVEGGPQATGSR